MTIPWYTASIGYRCYGQLKYDVTTTWRRVGGS